jgi:hypothetical protein
MATGSSTPIFASPTPTRINLTSQRHGLRTTSTQPTPMARVPLQDPGRRSCETETRTCCFQSLQQILFAVFLDVLSRAEERAYSSFFRLQLKPGSFPQFFLLNSWYCFNIRTRVYLKMPRSVVCTIRSECRFCSSSSESSVSSSDRQVKQAAPPNLYS